MHSVNLKEFYLKIFTCKGEFLLFDYNDGNKYLVAQIQSRLLLRYADPSYFKLSFQLSISEYRRALNYFKLLEKFENFFEKCFGIDNIPTIFRYGDFLLSFLFLLFSQTDFFFHINIENSSTHFFTCYQ